VTRRWRRAAVAAALVAALGAVGGLGRRALRGRAAVAATEMRALPGGAFEMGSTPDEVDATFAWCRGLLGDECLRAVYERELPSRRVQLSPFLLDATEVTNQQLAAWLGGLPELHLVEGRVAASGADWLVDLYPRYDVSGLAWQAGRVTVRHGYERKPITQVTWTAAHRYCAAQGRRLPTEAEWEYASRGAGRDRFPWGDDEPRCDGVVYARWPGQACAGWANGAAPVGAAPQDRSPQGVLDLAGNVAEWVEDTFRLRYAACPAPCRDPLARDNAADDGDPDAHVVRGGSFFRAAEACRSAGRSRRRDREVRGDIGFRCARSLQ
jgi:formylglycine-generating enzyme required for sulfatase activity